VHFCRELPGRARSLSGAVPGAWPRWALRFQQSSPYSWEVCNYSVWRQKAPERECVAGSPSIEIQVFNQQ